MAWGCQGSTSISLPMANESSAAWRAVRAASRGRRSRCATTMAPTIAAAFTSPMARAMPRPPNRCSGTASTSNSKGPGWWCVTPLVTDAEDGDPMSGGWALSTSWERTAMKALSPTGVQWPDHARPTAVAIGSSASVDSSAENRQVRRKWSVRESGGPGFPATDEPISRT